MATKARTKKTTAIKQAIEEQFVLAPASIPQEQFLESQSTITCYAGSMGAGKTFAIILNLVKFAARKNSTIIYFRRTVPELRMPGGVYKEAGTIFRKMFPDVRIKDRDMEFYIPSTNSVVKFASLQYESDVSKVLGAQYSVVVFDEATTFPFETFILPLMGRMRNAHVDYAPQMFWATNPKYDHGIYHWIKDFYLDDEGIPREDRSNVERYFVMENSKPLWFDNLDDASEYCKINYPGQDIAPRSFRAIRAHVSQNIPLLKANPQYIANLYAMTEIKRKINLDGSWTAREEEAGYFKREFTEIVNFPHMDRCKRVRAYDLASSLPSTAIPDPDWTRGVRISKSNDKKYYIEDIVSLRDRPHKVEELIFDTAALDPPGTVVVLSVDPGASGYAYAQQLRQRLAEKGIICNLVKAHRGSKMTRFLPFAAIAEAGSVKVVRGDWNETFFEELERFNGQKNNGHDDIADAVSDGIYVLNQGVIVPDMKMESLTVAHSSGFAGGFSFSAAPSMTFTIPNLKL